MYQAVSRLRKDAQSVVSDQGFLSNLDFIAKRGTGGLGGLFTSPQGRVLAQAEMAIDMFKKLGQAWPKISNLFADNDFSPQDKDNLNKILTKELGGGIIGQIKGAFKVAPYQGLSVADIINTVTGIAEQNNPPPQSKPPVPGQGESASPDQQSLGQNQAQNLQESVQNLQQFFQNLSTAFKPEPSFVSNALSRGAQGQATGAGMAGTLGSRTTSAPRITTGGRPGQPAAGRPTTGSGVQATQGPSSGGGPGGNYVPLTDKATYTQLQGLARVTGVKPEVLHKLASAKGVQLTVDPEYLK